MKWEIWMTALLILCAFVVGFICGAATIAGAVEHDAAARGFAHYSPLTGQWEWNRPEAKP